MTPANGSSRPGLAPAFVAANRYLGWGEPRGGVWFVGLEEADSWIDKPADEIVRLYEEKGEVEKAASQLDFAALGSAGLQIRQRTARILSAVSKKAQEHTASEHAEWYLNNQLWRPGSLSFQANLYPLGKKTLDSWPPEFESIFGFGAAQRNEYVKVVSETRFRRLRARWIEDGPQATVCFGAAGWEDFRTVFGVTSPPRTLADGKIHVHDAERIVLCYFFSRDWVTEGDADAIGAMLRDDWKVTIP